MATDAAESHATMHVTRREWQGPLPPPEILGGYSNYVENGAERLFHAWEQETAHRRHIENVEMGLANKDLNISLLDVVMGRLITLAFLSLALGGAIYTALQGYTIFASILGSGALAAVVWALRPSHGQKLKSKPDAPETDE